MRRPERLHIVSADRARSRTFVVTGAASGIGLATARPEEIAAMSAFNPVPAGGVEPSLADMIETWIEMAWHDGPFDWVGIANPPPSFAAAAYLSDEGSAEVFTAHDNRVTVGGQFFPNGHGTVVDGGYRLSGYIAAGFLPMDNGEMRWISEGIPDMQVAIDAAQIWLGIIEDQFGL
jgi:hypothetical protein